MARNWDDFKVFDAVTEKYLPDIGQGETMASQIAHGIHVIGAACMKTDAIC